MEDNPTLVIFRLNDVGWRVTFGSHSTIVTEEDMVVRGVEAINEAVEFVRKAEEEGYA